MDKRNGAVKERGGQGTGTHLSRELGDGV